MCCQEGPPLLPHATNVDINDCKGGEDPQSLDDKPTAQKEDGLHGYGGTDDAILDRLNETHKGTDVGTLVI